MPIDPAVFGEFFGTLILILLGDGVVAAVLLARSKAQGAGWMVITAGWALAVFAGVVVASSLGDNDAHLNPAFTVAAVITSGHAARLWSYIPAQILGGFAGGTLVWLFYYHHFRETEDKTSKLLCFCTQPAIRAYGNNLLCEVIATFVLVLVAAGLASKQLARGGAAPPPGLTPYLVGILVWSIGLSLGATTGYAVNPARDLGPRLAHAILPVSGKGASDWGYAWVPVLGPLLGAILAAFFVKVTGLG
jgi:glycerol uptake facilitator protein